MNLGRLTANLPIVQGGMAVKVSTAPLAAAVASEGGIGIIAGTGLKLKELKEQIRQARHLTDGILGVNVMVAVNKFKELIQVAVEENIDLIVAGAGFSRDIFEITKKNNIEYLPIVSSLRLAKISEKLGASGIIVEGKEAGGHLGTKKSLNSLIEKIVPEIDIPVIAAGGIIDGNDIAKKIKQGASGVQMGSRFVLSQECEVANEFKEKYLQSEANENVLIESPVGLPGRVIKNKFTERLEDDQVLSGKECEYLCLKKCNREFCIMKALNSARKGDMKKGLVFAGKKAHLIDKIKSVKNIFVDLLKEIRKF